MFDGGSGVEGSPFLASTHPRMQEHLNVGQYLA